MIPVNAPLLEGNELKYVTSAVKTGWISSAGSYIKKFEDAFAKICQTKYAITTTNGTSAIHLALSACGVSSGDEVIVPTFTMASTIVAIIYTGATPVLVDSEIATGNMDVSAIEQKITGKTKAILPVHIYGHPVDMNPIKKLAKKYKLLIIEDAAEAHGATYFGKRVGSLGDIAAFSFYANKIITTGEGGMVVTNSKKLAQRANLLKDLAHDPKKRFRHIALGFNYRMTNLQAALGLAQAEQIDKFLARKASMGKLYNQLLKDIPGLILPVTKPNVTNVYWMYGVRVEEPIKISKDEFRKRLLKKNVDTRDYFIPMHLQPIFNNMGLFKKEKYLIAEKLCKTGFYLPSGLAITDTQIKKVAKAVKEVIKEAK